jgi:fucose permease
MRFLKDNSLTLVLTGAFLASLISMALAGWLSNNEELVAHEQAAIGFAAYCLSGQFISSVFENWESEFLQMGFYVVLTAFLFQRGSSESKNPDAKEKVDQDPATRAGDPAAPWPVRVGGLPRALYSYSLGIALAVLFAASFVLHWLGSTAAANEEAELHAQAARTAFEYLGSAQLWFESFQNWQSEFLSTAVLIVLTIFLRFRGSPESKRVAAPHAETGE